MHERLLVVRVRTDRGGLPARPDGFDAARSGHWVEVDQPASHLFLFEFPSAERAEEALRSLAQKGELERDLAGEVPADVTRFRVLHSEGALRGHFDQAPFVSLVLRVSNPGQGERLADDVERVFAELRELDGFLGSLVGSAESLEEEVVGLAAWASEEAFTASVPPGLVAAVRLFRRAA